MNKSVYCVISITKEQLPWNWNQQNPQLRKAKLDEIEKKYKLAYFKLINTVVESGGTVCVDRATLDNEYRIFNGNIRVKIPESDVYKIKSLPFIENFIVDTKST